MLADSDTCTKEKCTRDKINIENAAEMLVSSQKEQEETSATLLFEGHPQTFHDSLAIFYFVLVICEYPISF